MDRKSWLWRRKSSEKSPSGETESSGSLSSHSERFSDDQVQMLSNNNNTQSPEVTSKVSLDDEVNDDLKALTEKLSDALVDIRAKEDLVKQHAKVAEEAVSGWERAENEVVVLKKQIDVLTQKNTILEERVGHLDGALKECLRQLRQAREEQEEKIFDAVYKKTYEWESKKSELKNQVTELQIQLQSAMSDSQNTISDARFKLEAAEKENSVLKLNISSLTKELELRIRERDLSTHAVETASKQHLDSIKKVAKLEAECRRLKAMARKANLANDQQSINGSSSVYVESFTDSQSDSGERMQSVDNELQDVDSWVSPVKTGFRQQFKNDRNLARAVIVPSVEIDLMDDFLEMEKLASLPKTQSQSNTNTTIDLKENLLRDELEAMTSRVNKLENELTKITREKENLEIALKDSHVQLKIYEDLLKQTEEKLVDTSAQLALSIDSKEGTEIEFERTKLELGNLRKLLNEAETNILQLQKQLNDANDVKNIAEVKLEDAKTKNAEAESRLGIMELEVQTLESRIRNLETELMKERKYAKETANKCEMLQDELSRMKENAETKSRLGVMELEVKTLESRIRNLESELEKERKYSKETMNKCEMLQDELSRTKEEAEVQRSVIVKEFKSNQDHELAKAASKYEECQKTIASIGRQLKSLASLDDFLIETDSEMVVV